MENTVGVLTPILLKELCPRANTRWEMDPAVSPSSFQVLCASLSVSITLRVIFVFKDMHLSCNVVPQIKPIPSSAA